jgi:DNA-binding response OmpR family regulator
MKSEHTRYRVLIIEDEGDICYLLKTVLRHSEVEVEHVNTIEQAGIFLKEGKPDLVFLDNHLPDGLGVNYIPTIKTEHPETGVIMITAHDGQSDRNKALAKGADCFLSKPFSRKEIYAAVDQVLGRKIYAVV